MSDKEIATLARELAAAMVTRAHSRSVEDSKRVLELQTRLCAAVLDEKIEKRETEQ